jgi:hypothetical protein
LIIPVLELVLSALLGLGFAALGTLLLRPRVAGVFARNECFLAGSATSAALLFPLSLLLRGRALVATAIVLGAALAVALGRRIRRLPSSAAPSPIVEASGLASAVLLAGITAVALAFAALSFRYPLWWDGLQVWASKAQRLFVEGRLGPAWYAGDVYDRRLLTYPALVPLAEALLSLLRGGFDFDRLKPVFILFHASLLLSTCAAARSRLSRPAALLATLLVALVPALSDRSAAGGYADMPQAAFVAATVAAAFRDEDARALPWMIGGLTVVKNEGLILASIASLAVAAFWTAAGWKEAGRRARAHGRGIAIVAGFFAARLAYLAWLRIDDSNFRSIATRESLAEALRRLPRVGQLCAESMFDVLRWGLLWPAFAVAVAYLLWRGGARERCLAASTGLAVGAYGAIFLETNWSLELHVEQAFPRLLSQLAPAAILVVMFAAVRAADRGKLSPPFEPQAIPAPGE